MHLGSAGRLTNIGEGAGPGNEIQAAHHLNLLEALHRVSMNLQSLV